MALEEKMVRNILFVILIMLSPICFAQEPMETAEYTKSTEYKIEVLENDIVQVRRADIVLRDGVEISRRYHRHCLSPGSDLSSQHSKVKKIAEAIWTPEVIGKYQERRNADKKEKI